MRRLSIAAAFLVATLTVSLSAWAIGGAIGGGGGGGGGGTLDRPVRAASIGDSISVYPISSQTWHRLYADSTTTVQIDPFATSGHTTAQILSLQWPSVDNAGYTVLFANGGTNTCTLSTTPANALTYAASAQADMQTIATDAAAQGMRVILANIPPIKGWVGWTADIQSCIDTYNTNHLAMAGVSCFVDVYDVLDADDDDDIDAGFDIGDGIHPNATGTAAMAAAVTAACGDVGGNASDTAIAMIADGTVTSPALSFSNNTDSGWYYYDNAGVHNIGVAVDGVNVANWNQYGLGIGVAPASGVKLHAYAFSPGGSAVGYFQNVSGSGAFNLYVGEDIASTYNHGAVLWHGSTAALYTGWAASQFGLRTGASGGMMLDSYNAGPIEARVNGSDRLNITSTLFEAGGAIISSGTVTSFRTAGAAASSGITLPTCDSTTQFHQFAVDDTNDTAAAMLCWCRRGADDTTYAWVSIHDNTTACIDP